MKMYHIFYVLKEGSKVRDGVVLTYGHVHIWQIKYFSIKENTEMQKREIADRDQ
jgi:hypothetical protein